MSRAVLLAVLALVPVRGFVLGAQLLAPLPELEDQVLVRACIGSIPAAEGAHWRVDALVHFIRHPEWRARSLRLRLPATLPMPRVGECWQYAARLSQPQGVAARIALLRNHLSGHARVDGGPLDQRLQQGGRGLTALRADISRRINGTIADPAAAALLAALAVGATGDVTARQWQVFNATGITHLVAISGMHVTFFAVLAMAVARRIWSSLAPRAWLPRRGLFASVAGCVLALLYALLAGLPVPAQRTVVMLVALLCMRECARSVAPAWSVAVALCAVLLYDPMALLGAGFWLSFAAVAAIVLLQGGRLQPPAPLHAALLLQWVVSIALLPVTVAIFGAFPAAGVLVNLVAIPVFSLLLVPAVLVATACLLLPGPVAAWCADSLLKLAGWVATLIWPALTWCADLPGVLWRADPPSGWYLLAVPLVVLALVPVAPRLRLVALALLTSTFLLRAPRPHHGELWIDVRGRGDSATVLLRTRNHLLLAGTGESYGSAGRAFARYQLPRLRAAGHARIDLWLPGALTRDVQTALAIAAAQLPVRQVLLAPVRAPPPEMGTCAGAAWQWDGIEFQLDASGNGRACVLTATRAGHSVEVVGGELAGHVDPGSGTRMRLDATGLSLRAALIGL